ncbi:MAG: VOC family protein [Methylocystis sp.]
MTTDPRANRIDFIEFPSEPKTLSRAKDFFRDVFGWTYQDWGPAFAHTKSSGVASGLSANAEHKTKRPLAVIFAINLEETRDRILQAGGRITKETFYFPGGKRFHFKDPAGNELAVWSDSDAG